MHTLFSVIHRRVNMMAGLAAVLVIIVVTAPNTALSKELAMPQKYEGRCGKNMY
jgi:hypothetical protein